MNEHTLTRTTQVPPPADPPRRALPDLRDRQTGRLTQLLQRRPDLRGTYRWADEVDELVRWSL
jgi:hypothetical protein